MNTRFSDEHVKQWHADGGVLIESFFTPEEVASVASDFEKVFPDRAGRTEAVVHKGEGSIGGFHSSQFATFLPIPLDCSPALNLIGVHPELMRFARAALGASDVHLYQCQVWAKFTGDADYDQPFHCDFVNHTLTVPSERDARNSITIICYFTDVSEAHGPMHYITRPDADRVVSPIDTLNGNRDEQHAIQKLLKPYERTSAAPAGSIFPYGIDVYHRGTNMTAPGGKRFAVMACYKIAGDDAIGYHAWPATHTAPWQNVFNHATPDQLSCFGVKRPGDPFWTQATITAAQQRYPDWDMSPWRNALAVPGR